MSDKKIYTRAEFEKLRIDSAREMARDESLRKDALNVLVRADRYLWIHQTTWFGEPILNLPQDIFAIQEIIFKTRPEFIIEVGVAWGGTLLFYSTLMEALGGKKIIGIDICIPNELRERLASHKKLFKRIKLIKGSSVEQDTLDKVKSIIGDSRKTMIILDSYHTHAHVLKELRLYSSLVGRGFYLVCGDTVVEDIPEQEHRARPWGP
ncbi:MAG: class I SAM-dependent methyltransferase, partial [Desulfobacteraceae bacterium]|nr:class I SAM-dependent methyltransferase [Desulfobacteraceae bacterium]